MATISKEQLWSLLDARDWVTLRSLLEELKNEKCAVVEGKAIVAYCLEPYVPMDVFESSLQLCLELCPPSFLNTFNLLERCKDPVKVERLFRAGADPNCRFHEVYGPSILDSKIGEFCDIYREFGHLDEEVRSAYHVILVLLKYGADYRNTRLSDDPYRRTYFAPQLSLLAKFPLMITLCSARHVSRLGNRSELRWVPMDLLRTLLYTFL
jgi:hypothetical protein